MTPDALAIIENLFLNIVGLLNGVTYPGTYFTIWGVTIAFATISIMIGLLKWFFDFNMSDSVGGNNKSIKVSEERKNDTK